MRLYPSVGLQVADILLPVPVLIYENGQSLPAINLHLNPNTGIRCGNCWQFTLHLQSDSSRSPAWDG